MVTIMRAHDPLISPTKRASDWRDVRKNLTPGSNPQLWKKVQRDFFASRISERYLRPIEQIQGDGRFRGEGFAIVALQCSLVEFLESTLQGKNYRLKKPGEHEYSDSGKMFKSFLQHREPFSADFDGETSKSFYEDVRCGVLHEARTKKGWIIRAGNFSNRIIDGDNRIVYRDAFQNALGTFFKWYALALPTEVKLQEAFRRKWDGLCEQ